MDNFNQPFTNQLIPNPYNNIPLTPTHLSAEKELQLRMQSPASYNQSHSLNPSVSSFHPTGQELQRYQNPPLTPPETPAPDLQQMQRYVLNQHFDTTRALSTLDRKAETSAEEIANTKAIVRRDMRELQAQIADLRIQLADDAKPQQGKRTLEEQVTAPTEEMRAQFSNERIAEAYLEEAGDCERTARRLREEAEGICPGASGWKLEEKETEFACCGGSFADVKELLEHVRAKHGFIAEGADGDPVGDETPTHAPANDDDDDKTPKPETTRTWTPLAIRQMPPPLPTPPPPHPTFPYTFLKTELGGEEWSPGYHFIPHPHPSILKSRAYWLLDADLEPYLPAHPGHHGAKLTPFFNSTVSGAGEAPEEANYLDCPVFIRRRGDADYTYFGNYSQRRFSDRLDYDRVMECVPEEVRRHWAVQLADSQGRRPAWVTEALREHFWPKPTYSGPFPTDSSSASSSSSGRVSRALETYAQELKEWEKESRMKVSRLTAENLSEAFGRADAEMEPGLRLWWEYLGCVGFDEGFVGFLGRVLGDVSLRATGVGKVAAKKKSHLMGVKSWQRESSITPWEEEAKTSSTVKLDQPGQEAKSTPATKPDQPTPIPTAKANGSGDLELAKQMHEKFTKAKGAPRGGGRGGGGGVMIPPHARVRR